ncbi:MAG: ABC transporter permease [Burkholderiales bacterium]
MSGQELRQALRSLLRRPGFAASVVLSLALGIGANAAVFSVASALLLRPLPYPEPERLVILWNRSPGLGIAEDWFSTAQYLDVRSGHAGFSDLAIAIGANYNLTGDGGRPERVGTIKASANLLPLFGGRAVHGRLFGPQDAVPGTGGRAVLSYATFVRRFGGDPRAVGRTLVLNGQPYEVIGVLQEGFDVPREVMPTLGGAEHAELVVPLPLAADAAGARNGEDYNIVGRLRPGVSLQAAQAEMDTLTAGLRRDYPDFYPPNGGLTFSIVPLHEQVVGNVRRALLVLSAAVALVLLIAGVNVANLLLARASERQREVAVRAALGAGRGRLVREQLSESLLLALAGGLVGLVLCAASVRALTALGSASVPRLGEVRVGPNELIFTALLAVASGLLFGLVPAWRLSRPELGATLGEGRRGSSGSGSVFSRRDGLRRLLVAGELALSVVLLVAAGLLIRSFARVQQVAPGFNARDVLTFELTATGTRYPDTPAVLETYRQLWQRLAAIPGVDAAGGVSALPLSQMMAWGPITVEGRTLAPGEAFINADIRVVGGDYFRAMEIPLVAGRLFDEHDTRDKPRVIVVDEALAAQIWPGQDPLGKRVRSGGFDAKADTPWLTVVGVVGRIKQDALDAGSRIALYHPHTQYPTRSMNVTLRSRTAVASLAASLRDELHALDPDLPVYGLRTMAERVSASLARRRFSALLFGLFAALALTLGTLGTYGVMAYQVSQGTRELGIRQALGATPRVLLGFVLREGLLLAASGVAVGLAAAFAVTRAMRALLFETTATDPTTFLCVPGVLLLAALAACYLPARRAAAVDPVASLRSD